MPTSLVGGKITLPSLTEENGENYEPFLWGCSSAGRAPALQAGGHGFESHHLHQVIDIGEVCYPLRGFEGEAVQSELPVDVRDRGRPSAQFARESNPIISTKRSKASQ